MRHNAEITGCRGILRQVGLSDVLGAKSRRWRYIEAQRLSDETGTPHEVDHFYPLQGRFVSGLHVENNLQIITISENRKKGIKCES